MQSVIVIDDDPDIVRLFAEFLEEHDVKVVGKGYSGKDAILLYKAKTPDVALIDIMMPNGSGFYAIRKIRQINPNARIIAVTADLSPSTQEKLEKLGIPTIFKPFDIQHVLSKIKN